MECVQKGMGANALPVDIQKGNTFKLYRHTFWAWPPVLWRQSSSGSWQDIAGMALGLLILAGWKVLAAWGCFVQPRSILDRYDMPNAVPNRIE